MSKAYNKYIKQHLDFVKAAYLWLVEHDIIKDEFRHRINTHDLSKFDDAEYEAYDKYFHGPSKTAEVKAAFDVAWLHHIHQNPHHWQHWVLVNDDDGTKVLEMPQEYVVEMLCDHLSFSFKENKLDEIFKWYDAHKDNMLLHKKSKALYEKLLNKYKDTIKDGEA